MIAAAMIAAAAALSLQQVLESAARYVAAFEQQLSGIVAEEQYVQEVRYPRGYPVALNARRRLRSDLLLVRPVDGREWMQFRDVFAVDNEPVRDREDRLMRIFLNPDETTESQAAIILTESARYNLGSVERTVNTPMLALRFLERENQRRLSFQRTRNARPAAMTGEAPTPPGHFRVATEVWVVEFAERERPTLIRTRDARARRTLRDLPAHGRFWIEPSSGRVLMSELTLDTRGARAVITVNYQSEPLLGLLVPTEMRERYDRLDDRTTIEGFASYGRFRQFQVRVDEKLGPIKK